MEKNEHDKITAFDTLYTTNHIQMLKVVMPYFDHSMRKKMAVYIKYLEFRYTLSYCNSHPFELCGCSEETEEFNWNKLCSEILPFCTGEEKKQIEQISGLFQTMETYKQMSQMMEMMKDMPGMDFPFGDLMPGGFTMPGQDSASDQSSSPGQGSTSDQSSSPGQGNGMMDLLMGMLSPEQKTMFEMFGGNNSHESE